MKLVYTKHKFHLNSKLRWLFRNFKWNLCIQNKSFILTFFLLPTIWHFQMIWHFLFQTIWHCRIKLNLVFPKYEIHSKFPLYSLFQFISQSFFSTHISVFPPNTETTIFSIFTCSLKSSPYFIDLFWYLLS